MAFKHYGQTISFGIFFCIDSIEWALVIFCFGLVFLAEIANTAIEIFVDHVSPEFHEEAGKVKDVAAGAVLVSAFVSVIIGLIIFLPKLWMYLKLITHNSSVAF